MAPVEARLLRLEDQMRELQEMMNGGPTVDWERCVRGRLHLLLDDYSARKLARGIGEERWTKTEKMVGAMLALITVGTNIATLIVAIQH